MRNQKTEQMIATFHGTVDKNSVNELCGGRSFETFVVCAVTVNRTDIAAYASELRGDELYEQNNTLNSGAYTKWDDAKLYFEKAGLNDEANRTKEKLSQALGKFDGENRSATHTYDLNSLKTLRDNRTPTNLQPKKTTVSQTTPIQGGIFSERSANTTTTNPQKHTHYHHNPYSSTDENQKVFLTPKPKASRQ